MKPLGTQLIAEFINCPPKILNNSKELEKVLKSGMKECGIGLESMNSHQFNPIGVTLMAIVSESHIAIHTYPEARHVSVDMFTCTESFEKPLKLLHYLNSKLKPRQKRLLRVLRGNPIEIEQKEWIVSASHYGFETKYHIKKRFFTKKSEYQKIEIIENDDFGRMMFIDKDLQIAEHDAHIYNESLISPIVDSKKRLNNVAILGGGDGGVLCELLKYDPRKVILVDIDNEVIKASKKYLKNICRNAFDDPRAEIVIEDVNVFLEKKQRFDAIIYDLTMHPEALTRDERSIFLNRIFSKIRAELDKNGIVTMQCCSEFDDETIKVLKKVLPKHFSNIIFSKVFIPSFCENWVFASARPKA